MLDITTLTYDELKKLIHDIQAKASLDQQKINAALRKVTLELEARIKVMPQQDKDLEAALLQNIITDLEKY